MNDYYFFATLRLCYLDGLCPGNGTAAVHITLMVCTAPKMNSGSSSASTPWKPTQ